MVNENKIEGTTAVLASIFVLFSAMIRPEISLVVAVFSLACLGLYSLTKKTTNKKITNKKAQ